MCYVKHKGEGIITISGPIYLPFIPWYPMDTMG